MRAALATAVRKAFERKLKDELPQFRRVEGLAVPDVCRVYEWKVTEPFRLYLMLQLHRQEDSFTLEIGWSLNGRWPEHSSFPDTLPDVSSFSEVTFRIGLLWSRSPDFWWDLAPRPSSVPLEEALKDYEAFVEGFKKRPDVSEGLAKVEPLVEDAFARLRQHALPYFKKIATAAEVDLPLQA
jgi:hypothetical protein